MKKTFLIAMFVMSCHSTFFAQQQNPAQVFNMVVAKDGSGDYRTIQSAIDAISEGNSGQCIIFVKNGIYEEMILIPEDKPSIHLIGQDCDSTIICYTMHSGSVNDKDYQYSVNNPEAPAYRRHAVFEVQSKDFYAENISFVNSYGVEHQSGPQALAVRSLNDRQSFSHCSFRSYQDTWFTTSRDTDRQYVSDCWIEGAVDYIFGGGNILFERCTLYNVRSASVITAPCHTNAQYGYVFRDCVVDGNQSAADGRQSLGRPWHHAPIAIYINTRMLLPVSASGWSDMGTIPGLFAEYRSVDAEGNPLDLTSRKSQYKYVDRDTKETRLGTSRTELSSAEAEQYTYENIISLCDGWNPRALSVRLDAPSAVRYNPTSHIITWTPSLGARGYLVVDHQGGVVSIIPDNRVQVDANSSSYTIVPVSQSGSLGLPAEIIVQ